MRQQTIENVKTRIHAAIDALVDIHKLPAEGLTIDAAALIHRQSMASIQKLMKFQDSMRILQDTATDF